MGLVKKLALPRPSPSRSNNSLAVVMGSTDPLPKAAVAEARQSKKRGRGEGCSRDGNGKESGGQVDNATSIGEAVSKTERLHGKLRKLEKQKLERLQGLAISSSEAPLSSSTAFPSSISKNPSSRDAF
ncbi:hypothetical protein LWI29_033582 [Acer saccharum]|uniref:Uncharacterized protein n=1 Tax=Acer saccharum TaxID=4024 RepID=A0AA39S679_ACESA|nr:hypothetical protein LWI29_033582 [Acer saccharum]